MMSPNCISFVTATILVSSFISSSVSLDGPSVKISSGELIGTSVPFDDRDISQFLNIPFAQAPMGSLRFKKPLPVSEKWTTPRDATQWPPACVQPSLLLKLLGFKNPKMTEDCLYLNVWSPKLPNADDTELKPVLVWIHGGGFVMGAANQFLYYGAPLAAKGDMVVVTINYRLGILGFLYTGDGENDAPGNMGLWDQAMALEWVQENIRYFGGDPKRVTIAGESAGGISVSSNVLSPVANKLFSAAITMSGSALTPWFFESKKTGQIKSKNILKNLKCFDEDTENHVLSHEDIECLQKLDAEVFVQESLTKTIRPPHDERIIAISHTPMGIFGDKFIPKSPRISAKETSKFNKRFLTGTVDFEGGVILLLPSLRSHPFFKMLLASDDADQWQRSFVKLIKGEIPNVEEDAAEEIARFYLKNATDLLQRKTALMDFFGDYALMCPTFYDAESKAASGDDVNTYLFSFKSVSNPRMAMLCPAEYKVCHGMELGFFFGLPLIDPKESAELEFDQEDLKQASEFIAITSDFVHNRQLKWPKYNSKAQSTFELNVRKEGDRIIPGFRRESCDLLRDHILNFPEFD